MTAPENTGPNAAAPAGAAAPASAPGAPSSPNPSNPPIACSLTSANLAEQAGRWKRLAARAMTGRDQTADGLRISFRAGPGVERQLRELTAVETRCCGWATWTVEPTAQEVVLDVRSAGDGVAALHSMFTGLQPAPEAEPRRLASEG
jgi:hypothetical protein